MLLVNSHVTSCAEFLHINHDARPNQRDIWKPWMSNKSRHIQLDPLGNGAKKNTHSTSRRRPHCFARWARGWVGKHIQHLLLKQHDFQIGQTFLTTEPMPAAIELDGANQNPIFLGWFVHSKQNGRPQTGGVFTKEFLHTPGFQAFRNPSKLVGFDFASNLGTAPRKDSRLWFWTFELVLRSTVVSYNDVNHD